MKAHDVQVDHLAAAERAAHDRFLRVKRGFPANSPVVQAAAEIWQEARDGLVA
jgi:hypothetical protein